MHLKDKQNPWIQRDFFGFFFTLLSSNLFLPLEAWGVSFHWWVPVFGLWEPPSSRAITVFSSQSVLSPGVGSAPPLEPCTLLHIIAHYCTLLHIIAHHGTLPAAPPPPENHPCLRRRQLRFTSRWKWKEKNPIKCERIKAAWRQEEELKFFFFFTDYWQERQLNSLI